MAEAFINPRNVRLTWQALLFLGSNIIAGCGVYYTLRNDVMAARNEVEAARSQSDAWERSGRERFIIVERRIERVEDASQRVVVLLERIDERTTEMKRRMDAQK